MELEKLIKWAKDLQQSESESENYKSVIEILEKELERQNPPKPKSEKLQAIQAEQIANKLKYHLFATIWVYSDLYDIILEGVILKHYFNGIETYIDVVYEDETVDFLLENAEWISPTLELAEAYVKKMKGQNEL